MTRGRTAALLALAPVGLLLATLAVPETRAEERKNSWEVGLLGGQTYTGTELLIKNDMHFGARAGWNFLPAFALELQYLHTSDAEMEGPESTLLADPTVLFANPGLTFSSDSYTLRFVINPANERRRFKPYVNVGAGVLKFTPDPKLLVAEEGELKAKVITLGGGVRQRLSPHLYFRAEFETEYAISEVYHNEHINVGVTWNWGGGSPADSDGDGILDLNDHCPDTPKGALVDKHDGCPWDLDLDGVMEGLDKCPETPDGWPVNDQGCPLDSDGDAVPDGTDACPDTPARAIVKTDGCPIDSDGDQIIDGIDRCPDTPQGAVVDPADSPTAGCPRDADTDDVPDGIDQCLLTPTGATVDAQGCPTDSDGDRVLDGIDQYPDTPQDLKLDREGCPRVRLDKDEPHILQNVIFIEGAKLYPGAEAWISLLLEAMNYWTDLKVEVGVYSDNSGSPDANRQITQRRGEVVKAWLVEQGVDPRRVMVKGYGAVNFIADNDSDEGKTKNRRVEVRRLSGNVKKHPKPAPPSEEPQATEPAAAPSGTTTPAPAPAPVEPEPPAEASPAPDSPSDAPDDGMTSFRG